jgi:hypothetical protein
MVLMLRLVGASLGEGGLLTFKGIAMTVDDGVADHHRPARWCARFTERADWETPRE